MTTQKWTPEQIEIIKNHSIKEASQILGKSYNSVSLKKSREGITKRHKSKEVENNISKFDSIKNAWQASEIQLITQGLPIKEIMRQTGRTYQAISYKKKTLSRSINIPSLKMTSGKKAWETRRANQQNSTHEKETKKETQTSPKEDKVVIQEITSVKHIPLVINGVKVTIDGNCKNVFVKPNEISINF